MSNTNYQDALNASNSAYSLGSTSIPQGYSVDQTFGSGGAIDDITTGFRAIAFTNGTDRIVAFAGTENLQDGFADMKLGWDQIVGRNRRLPYCAGWKREC